LKGIFDGIVQFRATVSDVGIVNLQAGDTIDFALGRGPDNSHAFDRVVLTAQITAVPEPSSLISAALGLVILGGYAEWRRGRSAKR
jgi:hypothetical protein